MRPLRRRAKMVKPLYSMTYEDHIIIYLPFVRNYGKRLEIRERSIGRLSTINGLLVSRSKYSNYFRTNKSQHRRFHKKDISKEIISLKSKDINNYACTSNLI